MMDVIPRKGGRRGGDICHFGSPCYHVVHMRLGQKVIRHPAQWFGFGQGCQMQQLRPHGMPLASPKPHPLTPHPKPLECVLQATDSVNESESMAQHGFCFK